MATWDDEGTIAGGHLVEERGPEHCATELVQTRSIKVERIQETLFLRVGPKPEGVEKLIDAVKNGPVTLLYSARDAKCNQAVALKEYLSARKELTDLSMHLAGIAQE